MQMTTMKDVVASSSAGLDGSGDDLEPFEQISMHLYVYEYFKSPFINELCKMMLAQMIFSPQRTG